MFRNIRSDESLKGSESCFGQRSYKSKILDHHFEKAMSVNWKILLENKDKPRKFTVNTYLQQNITQHLKRYRQKLEFLSINENLL